MNFSEIPADWQPARVRYSRRQGPGHIIEIEFLDGPLKGKRAEARKLKRQTRALTRYNRLKTRARRKALRTPCPACGKPSGPRGDFCGSCASSIRELNMDYLTAAATVIMKYAQEENDE